MKIHTKRWLMSMMKTSGSKRRYATNGRYADENHAWKIEEAEMLPFREPVETSSKFYNSKINYGLIPRFLRGQVGRNWDEVYAEIIARIPTKLHHHREMIFWFVAKDVELVDGELWDKNKQKTIWQEGLTERLLKANRALDFVSYEFYVNPITKQLGHIPQKSFRKKMLVSPSPPPTPPAAYPA